MGCFEPLAVKLKAFTQKLKASLMKKKVPQQAARSVTPIREQVTTESVEVPTNQVPGGVEVLTVTVEAVDVETKIPFESILSQLTTSAITHEVSIGQRLVAAKYGVALESIEPQQVSKQDSAISLKSDMCDSKPIYTEAPVVPNLTEAKKEEMPLKASTKLQEDQKTGKGVDVTAPFLPFDLAAISNSDVKAAEVRSALARSSYNRNSK
ncbi:hypothetical protein BC830DRAFT_1142379 [Chytriomyces sp. MP71]|nr:hypothetical protein BC830DRAFT_1142379 [Chytriomyces sp. MP71]